MSFAAKLAGLTVVGVIAIVAVTGGWVLRVADSIAEESSETAREYGVASLRDLMDGFVQIGLELDRMTALQGIIERVKAFDPSILSIDIVGRDGHIVYSTDPAGVGLVVPVTWRVHSETVARGELAPQSILRIREHDEVITGSVVLDAIGEPLATIVVTASMEATNRREIATQIVTGSAIAAGVCGGLAILFSLAAGRRLTRDLAAATDTLAGRETRDLFAGGLGSLAAGADAVWDEAEQTMAAAFRELEVVDETV